MAKPLSQRAASILNLLPFAHLAARTAPAPHIALASAALRHPLARRLPRGVKTVATVGLAAFAVASFLKGFKSRKGIKTGLSGNGEIERSSAS